MTPPHVDLAVAGGGAAGFFAALAAKAQAQNARVLILEKSREFLAKVAISGGGRCNVTHHCLDPSRLVTFYPRGGRELLGPFHRFQPADTLEWFESRGVPLKTEADGRVFPVSDSSSDIVNALLNEADALGVKRDALRGLADVQPGADGFEVDLTDGSKLHCNALVIATGGNRGSGGLEVAERLGHTLVNPVPSLFSFHARSPVLEGLAGISVDPARVGVPELNAAETGPLLITHNGLSGPAVLKLSAWQARTLAERDYKVGLTINWCGDTPGDAVRAALEDQRRLQGARPVARCPLFGLSRRLWERLVIQSAITEADTWARLPAGKRDALAESLTDTRLPMRGKSMNKEEFVTCGGVSLKEVDMKTFQSRLVPGLFFAGEVLDIDGVTGGFNFQAAWTGGHLAGTAAATQVA